MAQSDSEWEQLLKRSQQKHFSDATVFDILSKLPVKSILRFKSVCKNWYALFGDCQFIEAHLNRSVEGSDCGYLVRHQDFEEETYSSRTVFSLRSEENFEDVCELRFEPEPDHAYSIIASTDGIVCMIKLDYSPAFSPENAEKGFYFPEMDIFLWNPATRKSRTLPKYPGQSVLGTCLGFGFDSKNNDYKVVTISETLDSLKVNVYSQKTDSWRVIEANSYDKLHQPKFLVHVNGRMHCLAGTRFHIMIVSFDVVEEELIVMDMPEIEYSIYDFLVLHKSPEYSIYDFLALHESPASLGKSLILSIHGHRGGCQTWLMKEYGVPKSWIKLYYFPLNSITGDFIVPYAFLDNGKAIMKGNVHMLRWDSKNQVYEILNFDYTPPVVKYKESLVSVRSGSTA